MSSGIEIVKTLLEPRAPGQSFFDTSHQKWSEWKTNRSAVIAGRFRRKQVFFFHFFPFLDHLVLETPPPAITALWLVFHSDHFWCEVSKKDCQGALALSQTSHPDSSFHLFRKVTVSFSTPNLYHIVDLLSGRCTHTTRRTPDRVLSTEYTWTEERQICSMFLFHPSAHWFSVWFVVLIVSNFLLSRCHDPPLYLWQLASIADSDVLYSCSLAGTYQGTYIIRGPHWRHRKLTPYLSVCMYVSY